MRIDFGTAEFLGFIGVMTPAVFVLAGFVIAVMAFRFKAEVDVSGGTATWNEEQALQSKSRKLVRHYLIFGSALLAVFLVSSILELPGATRLVSASHAVVALAALVYFCGLLKKTYSFYFLNTRMTARKPLKAKVKVG